MSGFVDEAQLHAKGGNGGAGAVSFRREAHVDRGGPDGGDGGRGGDVWLEASLRQASLLAFRDHPHRRAGDGAHGSGKKRHGSRGHDVTVSVPVGTVVRGPDGAVLCDLTGPGDRWRAAEGGRGGHGNARFSSNARRAPAFAEQGELGEERWLDLELRLVADVALVGFPNVGKSTLVARISAAKPKVADYPFTTLQPHLGVVRVGGRGGRLGRDLRDHRAPQDLWERDDEVEIVVADVPGLVEGAAEGKGLGHRFLRHVERARVLAIMLDLAPVAERSPGDQLSVLLAELRRYRPELLHRPRVLVGSRADLTEHANDRGAGAAASDSEGLVSGGLLEVSGVTGRGVAELLARFAQLVTEARREDLRRGVAGASAEVVVHRPVPEDLSVVRLGPSSWEITGRPALRAVGLSVLTDEVALAEILRRLRRLGVDRTLARAGARDGDDVVVGTLTFTWYRERDEGGLDLTDVPEKERLGGRKR